jgi:hypothetical protein
MGAGAVRDDDGNPGKFHPFLNGGLDILTTGDIHHFHHTCACGLGQGC